MNRVKHRAVTPLLAVVMAATTAVGLAACGGDGENADTATTPPSSAIERPLERVDGAAVGRVEGSEMFIAVLDDGTNVRAYLCNGTVDEGTLDLWFDGSWDRSGPVTTLRAAKLALTIERSGDGYTGELHTADGKQFAFTATVPQDEAAGLLKLQRHDPDTGEIVDKHAIVLDNGDMRGAFAPIVTTCRYVKKTRVLADGTTQEYYVQVCR
jgi:hypothetical protein